MNDQQLHAYCQEWATWCYTRRYYLKPGAQNILARMHPSKSGREPNARNSVTMQFFNMAVHALADMTDHQQNLECFNLMYLEEADYVKRQADKMGIARSTYYRRSLAFARKAYSMSLSIRRAHEQHQNAGVIDQHEAELEPA